MLMQSLLSSTRVRRLLDEELLHGDLYTVTELLNDVQNGIFPRVEPGEAED